MEKEALVEDFMIQYGEALSNIGLQPDITDVSLRYFRQLELSLAAERPSVFTPFAGPWV